MRQVLYAGIFVLGCSVLTPSARACNVESYEPSDIDRAQVVVVGEVRNYRVISNDVLSEEIRKSIEQGTASEWERKRYFEDIAKGNSPGGYYARFDIAVRRVLKGRVGKSLPVTLGDWIIPHVGDDSSRLKSFVPSEQYFIALNKPGARSPVGRSADSRLLTVQMSSCLGPFMVQPGFAVTVDNFRKWRERQGRQPSSD